MVTQKFFGSGEVKPAGLNQKMGEARSANQLPGDRKETLPPAEARREAG